MRFSENEPAMPVWKQSARTPSISKALSISRFPDVRFVGSREYPARFLETPIDEYFSSDTGFAKDVKIEVIGEGNLEVVETFLPGRKSRIQRRVTFKGEMPVPIRLVFVRSARDGTQPWINNDESIAWKENKGVFLPSEIRGTSRTHPEREPQNFGVTFKWLVVNDTDALPRFSVDALSDDQRLRELIAEN